MIKALNLYAGLGGNRKLWRGVQVTAVENNPQIAVIYKRLFPRDKVIVTDAHQYLLDHYKEFDFIWDSNPCVTHTQLNNMLKNKRYPDLSLYQEILFLKHFFKGKYVVENTRPYYAPLIPYTKDIGRNIFWTNFAFPYLDYKGFVGMGMNFNEREYCIQKLKWLELPIQYAELS